MTSVFLAGFYRFTKAVSREKKKKKGVRPDGMKGGQRKRTSNMGGGGTKKSTEELSLVVVFVLQTLSRGPDSGNGTLVGCGV